MTHEVVRGNRVVTLAIAPDSSILSRGGRALAYAAEKMMDEADELYEHLKTLDGAVEWFEAGKTAQTAANLLAVATQYHEDEMIGDDTYRHRVQMVHDWLKLADQTLTLENVAARLEKVEQYIAANEAAAKAFLESRRKARSEEIQRQGE